MEIIKVNFFDKVLFDLKFNWCYPKQYLEDDTSKAKEIKKCWDIRQEHIPFNSDTWCKEANSCAGNLITESSSFDWVI